ncbi:MAG TPA: DUF4267 domain-containing protein [Chloroflexota bacterium]
MSVRFRLGYLGAAAVAVAIMLIGLRFAIDPVTGATSAGFGFSPVSLGETKGVRDIASGLVLLALLWSGQRRALGAALLAFAFIPTCDAAIVLLNGGAPAIAFGIHATTACLLVVLAGLLLWQPSRHSEVGGQRMSHTSHLTSGSLPTNLEWRSDIQ